jgi:hypothetical protein
MTVDECGSQSRVRCRRAGVLVGAERTHAHVRTKLVASIVAVHKRAHHACACVYVRGDNWVQICVRVYTRPVCLI